MGLMSTIRKFFTGTNAGNNNNKRKLKPRRHAQTINGVVSNKDPVRARRSAEVVFGIHTHTRVDGSEWYSVRIRATPNLADKSRVNLGTYATLPEAIVVRDEHIRTVLPGWVIDGYRLRPPGVNNIRGNATLFTKMAEECLKHKHVFNATEREFLSRVAIRGATDRQKPWVMDLHRVAQRCAQEHA
jgi:hypothetical protein